MGLFLFTLVSVFFVLVTKCIIRDNTIYYNRMDGTLQLSCNICNIHVRYVTQICQPCGGCELYCFEDIMYF